MLLSDHPRTEGDCSGRESKLRWMGRRTPLQPQLAVCDSAEERDITKVNNVDWLSGISLARLTLLGLWCGNRGVKWTFYPRRE